MNPSLSQQQKRQEKIGELYIFAEVIFFASFPIIANYSAKIMPGILFAGITTFIAAILFFFVSLAQKNLHTLLNKKAILYTSIITLFIVVIPSLFIFSGTKYTSGINTAIFLQMEVFFALIICRIFLKEKIYLVKTLGIFLVVIGAVAILYNGNFNINKGDLLIIAATIFYPVGNIYAKKALKILDMSPIIFFRSFFGGLILIAFSLIYEDSASTLLPALQEHFWLIFLTGILSMGISKVLWYEGLKRIEITKATSIAMSYPALSLILAIVFLHEDPTIYQIFGLIITVAGTYLITKNTEQ